MAIVLLCITVILVLIVIFFILNFDFFFKNLNTCRTENNVLFSTTHDCKSHSGNQNVSHPHYIGYMYSAGIDSVRVCHDLL